MGVPRLAAPAQPGGQLAANESQAPPEAGYGRGVFTTSRGEPAGRIPLIGVDAGCIPGTAPGCSAAELDRAGRDIVRSRMHRRRFKPA